MNNRIHTILILGVSLFLNPIYGQVNTLKLLAKIDKYKIYATLKNGKQNGNSIQDTTSGIIHSVNYFLRVQDTICSFFITDSVLYVIKKEKGFSSWFPITIIPIIFIKGLVLEAIDLPRDISPEGFVWKDKWYCTNDYAFKEYSHVRSIEKCSMLQSNNDVVIFEKYSVIYLIDYKVGTVKEISRLKIE